MRDITKYLQSQKQMMIRMLEQRGIKESKKVCDELINFMEEEANGIFDLAMRVRLSAGVDLDIANQVDKQIFDRIILPKYEDFLQHNERLIEDLQIENGEEQREIASSRSTSRNDVVRQAHHDTMASFYFSPEDEEEIRRISQQSTANSQQKVEEIYDRVAEEVIEKLGIRNRESGITGEDKERRNKRLKGTIISRLKDARDALETKEALSKPWKIGGMDVSVEEAERIVKEVEKAREVLGEELKLLNVSMRQSANAAMRDREIASSVRPPRKDIIGKQDLSIPEIEAPQNHVSRITYHVSEKLPPLSSPPSQGGESGGSGVTQATSYKLQATGSKPAVDSVSSIIPPAFSKPKLMGPMEELSTMSLEDFRRLGNAADAVRKLNDKVELLAADSLLEKKKGLDAWKKSEVYKFYLIMGTESLEKKIGIAEVVALRKKQNQPTLTTEEFSAVADLNRKISFSN